MKKSILIILLIQFIYSYNLYSQKKGNQVSDIGRLQQQIDSLKLNLRWHNMFNDHNEIQISKIRSRLALELNRNFVFYGNFFELESENFNGSGYQRIFKFVGYQSKDKFKEQYKNDKGVYYKLVRDYVKQISNIVRDGQSDPTDTTTSFIFYPNRVKIVFVDNSDADESIFEADSFLKSIKVRVDGVLQEVGWE